jgi:hypothetical protein
MSTFLHDLRNAAVVAAAIPPAVITDTTTGAAVDLAAADGPCFAVQQVGALAADCVLSGTLEESADGTTWAAISDGAFTPVAAADAAETIPFTRSARYVRWSGTPDGGVPSAAVAVLIVQQKKLF